MRGTRRGRRRGSSQPVRPLQVGSLPGQRRRSLTWRSLLGVALGAGIIVVAATWILTMSPTDVCELTAYRVFGLAMLACPVAAGVGGSIIVAADEPLAAWPWLVAAVSVTTVLAGMGVVSVQGCWEFAVSPATVGVLAVVAVLGSAIGLLPGWVVGRIARHARGAWRAHH